MTFPSFVSGEVLRAEDMNAVGLWKVGGGTFTNAATVDITGFSSEYDSYRFTLVLKSVGAVTQVLAQIYQGGTVRNTNYYGAGWYYLASGGSAVIGARNNQTNFYMGDVTTRDNLVDGVVSGIGNGTFNINYSVMDNANVMGANYGYSNYAGTNSFDRIRIIGNSANITGYWYLMGMKK
jgi:hypothetical protein